ncbi:MAG: lysylphosphatidylglycerol synthase transmembrane domain-containing protein [Cytophagaceae bacterium]
MNPLVKQILQYLIMLGLGIFLMWLVFRDLNFDLIVTGFQEANYWWISAALVVSLVAHYSRAVRWKLLMDPLGYSPSNFRTFLAVMTGYFANSLLPRAGEVSRCYVLKRTDNIPFNIAFGSVVAERVIDVICLLIMTALAFFIEFDHIKDFFYQLVMDKVSGTEASMQKLYVVLGIATAVGALIVYLLYKFRDTLLSIEIVAKIYHFIIGLIDGMTSVWKLKRKWEFIFHTILIWFCYYFMMYVIFFSLPSTAGLSLGAALVVMVVGGFGMSAPVTAGMGAYHFMVAAALQLYGVTLEQGKVFAIISHSSQTISLIIFGGICALLSFSLKPKVTVEDGN